MGRFEGAGEIGFREHNNKLFSAKSGDKIQAAKIAAQLARDFLQHDIAPLVAERVVDQFEVVDIHHQDREWPRVSSRSFGFLINSLLVSLPVGQAGQEVPARFLFRLLPERMFVVYDLHKIAVKDRSDKDERHPQKQTSGQTFRDKEEVAVKQRKQ